MNGQAQWWMYLLNAFTPVIAFLALVSIKASKEKDNLSVKGAKGISPPEMSPLMSSLATALTQVVMGGILYALWLGGHWLVFWFLDKPLNINGYFYKPALVIYWYPYLFGLFCLYYFTLLEPKISQERIKNIMYRVFYLGFLLAFYMVIITYLKWLQA